MHTKQIIVPTILVLLVSGIGYWYFTRTSTTVISSSQGAVVLGYDNGMASTSAVASENTATTAATTTPVTKSEVVPAKSIPITNTNTPAKIMNATLETSMGTITMTFFPDTAPNTVANFIRLAKSGFYDGTKFHRVIKGFMDQGGDPLTKDDTMLSRWGTGGPGYQFDDEIVPGKNSNTAGTLAMANSGPNTAGSQFFINAVDNHFLDPNYTVFGMVTAGMDVVTAINSVKTDSADRPLTPIVLKAVIVK